MPSLFSTHSLCSNILYYTVPYYTTLYYVSCWVLFYSNSVLWQCAISAHGNLEIGAFDCSLINESTVPLRYFFTLRGYLVWGNKYEDCEMPTTCRYHSLIG